MKKYLLLLAVSSMVCCAATKESELIVAAQKGDLLAVKKALETGADVNWAPMWGEGVRGGTALMKAASKGNTEIMKVLIDAGAEVSEIEGRDQPHAGKPVLRFAIESGSPEAVRMLIKAGARLNEFTEDPILRTHGFHKANARNIPLLSSAIKSRASIVVIDELIAGGADVNQKDMHKVGWTPLMIAAYTGYTDAAKKLLAADADKTLKNPQDGNRTALDYAKERGHKEIVALLQDQKPKKSFWSWFGW